MVRLAVNLRFYTHRPKWRGRSLHMHTYGDRDRATWTLGDLISNCWTDVNALPCRVFFLFCLQRYTMCRTPLASEHLLGGMTFANHFSRYFMLWENVNFFIDWRKWHSSQSKIPEEIATLSQCKMSWKRFQMPSFSTDIHWITLSITFADWFAIYVESHLSNNWACRALDNKSKRLAM